MLVIGIIIGAFLSAKLSGNFEKVMDFTVLKVMLSAVVVGSVGVYLMVGLDAAQLHIKPLLLGGVILGALIFGVDMATLWELIASQKTIPEVRDFIGADSLGYLSIDGLVKAVALPKDIFCLACFTGNYPIPVQLEMDKLALESISAGKQ